MKIGLSYSRCVRDIVDGKVDINDVLVLITRTDFDPRDDEQWAGIWTGYGGGQTFGSPFSSPEWMDYPAEDEAKFRGVSIELYSSGKMHQPRQFGARPHRLPYYWLETIVSDTDLETSPVIKDAWDKFQLVSSLKGTPLKAHNE
jgi:hypothetical protein